MGMDVRMQAPATMMSPSPVYQRRPFAPDQPPLRRSRLSAIEKGFQLGDAYRLLDTSDADSCMSPMMDSMSPMYDHRVVFPQTPLRLVSGKRAQAAGDVSGRLCRLVVAAGLCVGEEPAFNWRAHILGGLLQASPRGCVCRSALLPCVHTAFSPPA